MKGSLIELENIKDKQKGADKRAAKLGIELAKAKKLGIIESDKQSVDSAIFDEACNGAIIATEDRELRNRIRDGQNQIIILRQGSHLALLR